MGLNNFIVCAAISFSRSFKSMGSTPRGAASDLSASFSKPGDRRLTLPASCGDPPLWVMILTVRGHQSQKMGCLPLTHHLEGDFDHKIMRPVFPYMVLVVNHLSTRFCLTQMWRGLPTVCHTWFLLVAR